GDTCRVRQAVARTGDEAVEHVVGIERQRLIALVEHAAARKVVTAKTHRDEPAGHLLRGSGKRLLALALAETHLRGRADGYLDNAVRQLARHHLIEPDTMKARVLIANGRED